MKNSNIFKNLQINKYVEMLPDFKEERTQQITTIALTLAALSFFGIFAINPTLSTITRLNKELEDSKFVEEQLQRKINNIAQLQKSYTQIQDEVFYVTDAVPVSAEAPLLAAQIQALASRTNASIVSLQVFEIEVTKLNTEEANSYSSFSFNVSSRGSREDLLEFMRLLSTMQRILTLDIVSLTKTGSEGEIYQLNINGSAHFKN